MSSEKFREWAKKEISKTGPLHLSDAICAALTHPDFGYYHSEEIIGSKGDFITAPEVSQMFGELVGAFLAYIWEQSGQPENSLLCEFGPGRGTLSVDINSALAQISPQFSSAPLHLIETSTSLREIQKTTLKRQSVYWHNDFKEIPNQPLFAVANEFFDALGVNQAIFDGTDWRHRLLDFDTQFELVTGPILNSAELEAFNAISLNNQNSTNHENGTIIEYSPKAAHFSTEIALHIKQFGGAFLIIDYGKSNQIGDTIQAVSNHKPVEPWSNAGNADISHWVDFDCIKRASENAGARFIGPVSQSQFFTQIGIKQRAEMLANSQNPEINRALFAAVDRLISPAHMGNLFQVGLIIPAGEGLPPGFQTE